MTINGRLIKGDGKGEDALLIKGCMQRMVLQVIKYISKFHLTSVEP